ncbi:MAG: DUF4012 domain-containing protein [Candidatus Gracilibacteria bacterium]
MPRFSDIRPGNKNRKLDLRNNDQKNKDSDRIKQKKNAISKRQTPINEVKDLYGTEPVNFLYLHGKKFTPPKFLGNLIRIGLVGFLILLIINSINVYFTTKTLQDKISAQAYEGYSYLISGGESATKIQFQEAGEAFNQALENFSEAQKNLWFIDTDRTFYSHEQGLGHAVNALLNGGKSFASAGEYFTDALEEFNKIPIYFVSKNRQPNADQPSLTDTLKNGLDKVNLAIEQIALTEKELFSVDENTLPSDIALRVKLAKSEVQKVSATLQNISKYFPALLKLLGDRYPHRYLILLQNNNEIRPTGGFIGSYALLDLNEGYIENLSVNDVYDLDGAYGGVIEPPDEMKALTQNWRFRDSNYSPDFPVSAAKARWFLQKEGGPGVDTVIAINQGLLKDLLEISGPVQVGNFGLLDSENYNLLLSFIIESKIWGAEDPKHILKVFIPAFIQQIMKEENIGKIGSKLYRAVEQKHIMLWSADEDAENLFDSIGVSGRIHENADREDYLTVTDISIGGTKSDQFVREEIRHDTTVGESGELVDTVTIKRSHLWTDDIYYQWKKILNKYGFDSMPDQVIDILGRGRNETLMRIYVPDGSIFLGSSDEKIETKYDNDLKKTYFFTRMEIRAGESKEVTVKYQLPFTLKFSPVDEYKLIVQKQPGSVGSVFTKTISTAEGINTLDSYPSETRLNQDDSLTYATNLVYDRYFSVIFSK